jgi:hypothetical protein
MMNLPRVKRWFIAYNFDYERAIRFEQEKVLECETSLSVEKKKSADCERTIRLEQEKLLGCEAALSVERKKSADCEMQLAEAMARNTLSDDEHAREMHKTNKKYNKAAQRLAFSKSISVLRQKYRNGQKIRVCYTVVYGAAFPGRPLFEKMLADGAFDPFILVIPDTLRGHENMIQQLHSTYTALSNHYSAVYLGYDEKSDTYIDFDDKFDLCCYANPYDEMTHESFSVVRMAKQGILPFYISYAYMGRTKFEIHAFDSPVTNSTWKFFLESSYGKEIFEKYIEDSSESTVVTGYCKMDFLSNFHFNTARTRKKIIISPHHTVREWKDGLNLSNFLRYSELFLELPQLYPDIDFIFRPHPLLFVTLASEDLWGKTKTEKYLTDIRSFNNVVYSDGPDYFDLFADSDGLIHDCGSFLAEYFYTDKPQCYLLRSPAAIEQEFLPGGREMLDHAYQAFSGEDITHFIDCVIVAGKDTMQASRLEYAIQKIRINYPQASEIIIEYLKKEFL